MNITEAYECVVGAVECILHISDLRGLEDDANITSLRKALLKIKPRVERMRSRLDHARARRAGKPRCPKGLEP